MSTPEAQLVQVKQQIEQAKQLKYRCEAQLEELQRQKQLLLAELQTLQVGPDDLDREIARLQSEVQALLGRAAALLPPDLQEE